MDIIELALHLLIIIVILVWMWMVYRAVVCIPQILVTLIQIKKELVKQTTIAANQVNQTRQTPEMTADQVQQRMAQFPESQ